MIHLGLDPTVLQQDVLYIVLVPLLSYILKVILKPSGVEVTAMSRVLALVLVGMIRGIGRWLEKHNPLVADQMRTVKYEMSLVTDKLKKRKAQG